MQVNGFPSDLTPPEEKKEKWFHLAYANEIESRFTSGRYNYQDDRARYLELRRQAEGLINIEDFKPNLGYGGDTSLLNLRYDAQSPAPNIVNRIVGKFSSQVYYPNFTPIEPRTINELDKERDRIYKLVTIRKESERLRQKTGIGLVSNEKDLPADNDDAELWASMNVKAAASVAAEKIWSLIKNNSKYKEIEQKIWRDLVVLKKAVISVGFDHNKNVELQYIDFVNFGTAFVNNDDASDSKYMFHLESMTLDKLYLEANGQIEFEELREIARSAAGQNGNPMWNNTTDWNQTYYPYQNIWQVPWASFNVDILKIEYKSTNIEKIKKEYINPETNKYKVSKVDAYYEIPKYGKKEREVFSATEEVIYKCCKVVGRQTVYNYGIKENQPVEVKNGLPAPTANFSYCVIQPNIYDMQNKSLLEAIIPSCNEMILCHLKMQLLIAKAKPPGVAVDVATTTNAIMGVGGAYWSPLEHQAVFEQIGSYYYSSLNEDGTPINNPQPIRELINGISPEIGRIIEVYNFHLKNIYDITGHSDGMDGTMQSERALVGIQKMVARNSNNSLKYIEQAFENILGQAVKKTMLCAQMAVRNKHTKQFELALGSDIINAVALMKEFSMTQLGIELELLPNEEQIQSIENLLGAEIKNGTIKSEDAIAVLNQVRKSPLLAEKLLINARKRFEVEKLAMDKQRIDFTAQQQQKSAIISEEEKRKTIEFEVQVKSALIDKEWDRKERYLKLFETPSKIEQEIVKGDIKKELIEEAKADTEPSSPQGGKSLKESSISGTSNAVKEPQIFPSKPTP